MIRPVTYFEVVCDEPGCGATTTDLGCDYSAWVDDEQARQDWIDHDGVALSDGRTFCEKHAAAQFCDVCGELRDECECSTGGAS